MVQPLISVVVPVYRVEPYLRTCLDSIVGQSYQNLQILLVDDGSPDCCGEICDEYAGRDERIQVIHQKNQGLSAARNAAMEVATGEWIGFVDSDDWIEPDMYTQMLEAALQTGSDMVLCGKWLEYPRRTKVVCWEQALLLGREEAMGYLLEDQLFQNTVWDKLVRRELYDGIRFPVGRNYEDVAVMYRIVERAERVCCLSRPMYHYRQRSGSIMSDRSLKNSMDWYENNCERSRDLALRWPQYRQLMEIREMSGAIPLWCCMKSQPSEVRNAHWQKIMKISEQARTIDLKIWDKSGKIGLMGKLVFRLMRYPQWWSFQAAALLDWIYRLRHKHGM